MSTTQLVRINSVDDYAKSKVLQITVAHPVKLWFLHLGFIEEDREIACDNRDLPKPSWFYTDTGSWLGCDLSRAISVALEAYNTVPTRYQQA